MRIFVRDLRPLKLSVGKIPLLTNDVYFIVGEPIACEVVPDTNRLVDVESGIRYHEFCATVVEQQHDRRQPAERREVCHETGLSRDDPYGTGDDECHSTDCNDRDSELSSVVVLAVSNSDRCNLGCCFAQSTGPTPTPSNEKLNAGQHRRNTNNSNDCRCRPGLGCENRVRNIHQRKADHADYYRGRDHLLGEVVDPVGCEGHNCRDADCTSTDTATDWPSSYCKYCWNHKQSDVQSPLWLYHWQHRRE